MSEDEKNPETHFELAEVGAEVTRDDTEKTSGTNEEKIRKAKLLDEMSYDEPLKREVPEKRTPTATIPDEGKLGEKFTIKLDKRYDKVNLLVYQGETVRRKAGNDNAVHDGNEKDTDEISYNFYDPLPLKGKEINGLVVGKYLVKVTAHGTDATDQLEQEKVVDIK